MQSTHEHSVTADAVLSGLTVYSSDFVPLGWIDGLVTDPEADPNSLAGRRMAIQPNDQLRSMLDDDDLVVSESMIFDISPEQDRVILNVPARRVVEVAAQLADE